MSTPDGYLEFTRKIAALSYCDQEDITKRKFKSEEIYPLFCQIFEEVNERTVNCVTDILDVDLYDSLDVN
jgi:hypothetical protein